MAEGRASVIQTHLEGVQQDLIPGVAAALEHVDPADIEAISSASRVGWVDMEFNYRLNEGIYQAVGIEGGRAFFRTLYNDFFERSLFRAFMSGIKALGGSDPGAYLKHAKRGWSMIWRDLGDVEIGERTENSIELVFTDQPQRHFEPGLPWFEYLNAVFEVAYDICGCEGSSEVVSKRPSEGRAVSRFYW